MNKHLYRVVFNAARGLRVVVQETARSAGKATGTTPAIAAGALFGVLVALPGQAQIVGAPGVAPGLRPTVLVAPNGVPLVNIQTPSAAGVSRNLYHQFDVQSRGVILNNSRSNVQTQLGGWVQANPYLATGPARIILNEIVSGNPTQLRGAIEVGGQRAEVIVANPAGIAVDGGTFVNASRATLTTGAPQLNAAGGLDGYVVRGGTVSIEGAGLDARSTDYAAILARAIKVNAGLWANELKVVTGANQVSADQGQISPATGTGSAPIFALDSSLLGGMYAGKITLIGTEHGVGARNAGTIMAADGSGPLGGVGELVVTAAGRLENIGTMQAARRADLAARSLANSGRIASGGDLKIATPGTLGNAGGTLEAQSLQLASAGTVDNRGGTLRQTSGVGLTVTAPILSNTAGGVIGAEPVPEAPVQPGTGSSDPTTPGTGAGTGTGPGTSTGTATASDSSGGSTSTTGLPSYVPAPGHITAAGRVLNDGGRIYAGGAIQLDTPQVDNHGGTLTTTSLSASGPSFSNAGGTLNVSQAFSASVDRFDNTGGTLRAGSLQIASTGELVNTDGQLESSGDASLAVGGGLANTRGTVSAAGALLASVAGALDNTGGQIVQSGGDATRIAVAGALNNNAGIIGAAGNATVTAGALRNDTGRITAMGDLNATIVGAATNIDGTLAASGNATLTADTLHNTRGSVAAVHGDLRVTTTGQTLNAAGKLQAGGSAVLANGGLVNTAGQIAGSSVSVDTRGHAMANTQGTIAAVTTVTVNAGALANDAGLIQSGGAMAIDTHGQALVNTNASGHASGQGGIASGGMLALVAGVTDNSAGFIGAQGDLSASTGPFTNDSGGLVLSQCGGKQLSEP